MNCGPSLLNLVQWFIDPTWHESTRNSTLRWHDLILPTMQLEHGSLPAVLGVAHQLEFSTQAIAQQRQTIPRCYSREGAR